MTKYAIDVKDLKKKFGKIKALRGVSFSVKPGEIFGLLGPNGAGKSTTINILSGLLKQDSGEFSVLGKDINEVKDKMNTASAYTWLSGIITSYQNLKVFAKIYGVKNYEKRIQYLADAVGIRSFLHKKVYCLSSGQMTRLNLCKGLINSPKVLLLDEATVGLDPAIAFKIRNLIQDINKKEGTTILFTSHMMHEVEILCDRIAFLSEGRIFKIGSSSSLKKLIKKQVVVVHLDGANGNLAKLFKDDKTNLCYLGAKGNKLIFEIESGDLNVHDIIDPLFKKGIKIRDIEVKRPSLDDVFNEVAKIGGVQ